MFKKGDLIECRNTGLLASVSKGPYTYRFMEREDYEMVACGMGDLAGVYATAYDIIYMTGSSLGNTRRIKSSNTWRLVSRQEEAKK